MLEEQDACVFVFWANRLCIAECIKETGEARVQHEQVDGGRTVHCPNDRVDSKRVRPRGVLWIARHLRQVSTRRDS